MKKQLFNLIGVVSAFAVSAQLPVSTSPTNKKAVLEEFTGIHCGYCPDGHLRANNFYTADPNNVILINIHSGGYANPSSAGDIDFRTDEGTAIDNMPSQLIAGYPAGTMNRRVFAGSSQTSGGMAQSRGSWATTGATIKSQSAYVNVALEGSIDVNTRMLTVKVETYYTGNSPASTNSLTVMLLENGIAGPQSNYGAPYYNLANYNADGTYSHNHVLRATITPTFGLTIPVTTSGTTFTTTLTYQIPTTYGISGKTSNCVLANLELVAFVTETDVNIINAAHGPISYTGLANTLDIGTNGLEIEPQVCAGNLNPSFKFTNNGSTAVTSAVFSYVLNSGAVANYSWTGNVNALQTSPLISLPAMAFSPLPSNSLNINVVSVNGSTDQNAANNVINKTLALTTNTTSDLSIQMDFKQDRWGSECVWTIYDEVTGAVIETDGPFNNLGSNTTFIRTKNFDVPNNTCFRVETTDSGGNGINGGFGAGGYTLTANGDKIMSSNGKYGKKGIEFFRSVNTTGITKAAMNIGSVKLYPNPAAGSTALWVNLSQSENISVNVINSLGQQVSSKSVSLPAGDNKLQLSTGELANGIYFVNVTSQKGSVQQKLIVANK